MKRNYFSPQQNLTGYNNFWDLKFFYYITYTISFNLDLSRGETVFFILGYVLDGFPSLSEDYMSIKDQLELVKNWKLRPDFIINMKVFISYLVFIKYIFY